METLFWLLYLNALKIEDIPVLSTFPDTIATFLDSSANFSGSTAVTFFYCLLGDTELTTPGGRNRVLFKLKTALKTDFAS